VPCHQQLLQLAALLDVLMPQLLLMAYTLPQGMSHAAVSLLLLLLVLGQPSLALLLLLLLADLSLLQCATPCCCCCCCVLTLDHEVLDDAVEVGALEAKALLACMPQQTAQHSTAAHTAKAPHAASSFA
jgi:hypothetical protein